MTERFKVGEQVWLLPGAKSVDTDSGGYFPALAQVVVPTLVTVKAADNFEGVDYQISDGGDIVGYVAPEYLSKVHPDHKNDGDAINPDHYKFSDGVELISITENLTGNGAQAVQYIARATRLDGRNKGSVIEDLNKSLWFTQREIERLS